MNRPRILLFGSSGQLGRALKLTLPTVGELLLPSRQQVDLQKPNEIRGIICETSPDLIINAAAFTQVDRAETEVDTATAVNVHAPAVMAEALQGTGGVIVHYSTDYVFDGEAPNDSQGNPRPYKESDLPNPINVYGKTKLDGEEALRSAEIPHLILRTSWVFSSTGPNFVLKILDLACRQERLEVVSDQVGGPCFAGHLATATTQILSLATRQNLPDFFQSSGGLFHLSVADHVSWYGFAKEIVEYANKHDSLKVKQIVPVDSSAFSTDANRPAWSALNPSKILESFGVALQPWVSGVRACLDDIYI